MTPARLEVVEAVLSSPFGVKGVMAKRLGLELLVEVKRLREALEEICRWDDCERGCASVAENALAGEEPTP